MEGPPKNIGTKEKKRSTWREATAIALSILTQAHPQAKALELPPETSWSQGIQEKVLDAVRHDKYEHYFIYLKYNDGHHWSEDSGKWLPGKVGAMKSVMPNFGADTEDIYKNHIRGTGALKNICVGHSHSATGVGAWGLNTKKLDALPAPPSRGDITGLRKVEGAYRRAGLDDSLTQKFQHFVADQRGIWYYRQAKDTDYKTQEEKELSKNAGSAESWKAHWKIFEAFALKAAETTELTNLEEYKKLQQSYKIHVGGITRLAEYDKIASEPDCAGVDFDPETYVPPSREYIPKKKQEGLSSLET